MTTHFPSLQVGWQLLMKALLIQQEVVTSQNQRFPKNLQKLCLLVCDIKTAWMGYLEFFCFLAISFIVITARLIISSCLSSSTASVSLSSLKKL